MVVKIYGDHDLNERANVVTFNFEHGNFQFLQHSFLCRVFGDIFGIQVRSGCFCAGPYGIDLLQVDSRIIS
jgi:selenocysteine lyase/cysteine desulfurase